MNRPIVFFISTTSFVVIGISTLAFFSIFVKNSPTYTTDTKEDITIIDDTLQTNVQTTNAYLVGDLLENLHAKIQIGDESWPNQETPLISGMTINIQRMKTVEVETKEGKKTIQTTRLTGEEALTDNGILLDEHDISIPDATLPLQNSTALKVIRVTLEDQTLDKPIPFEKVVNEDQTLSWRKSIVTQKGLLGIKRFTYQITSYDSKEIGRKLIDTQVVMPPVNEIRTQGTYVQVGKSSTGAGTWYAFTGTLAAASPWLPLGSYARVTNPDNGKQVIVEINDRGPFGKGRIIDLDKVAFEKISSLGAGIINVKVEPITN